MPQRSAWRCIEPPAIVRAVLAALLAGFGLGLSLIVAIGAQNAFVLRQGLRGERVALVVGLCAGSDVVLIAAGVAGAGALLAGAPRAVDVVRVAGALFLLGYAALAARRALRPAGGLAADPRGPALTARATVATTLALTWLNPHVYLDTVLLVGTLADGRDDARWAFGAGAGLASIAWFAALGRGAASLRGLFARPAAWRVLDGLVAVVMATLAANLLLGVGG